MTNRSLAFVRVLSVVLPVLALAGASHGQTPAAAQQDKPRQLQISNKPWTGDFDQMLERRMIRIYAPFSRSLYYNDKGRERGIAVELARDWERYLNVKYAKQLGKRPLTIYIAPATRDKLLPYLTEGLADVAIGNLTVTDERLKEVDFVAGDEGRRTISEVVVTGPKSPELKTLDDLAGKRVHVRKASSYFDSLQALNARFKREGKPEVTLIPVPDSLEDEDMMEMLDAGLIELMVVDDWKAHMWTQVLPKTKVRNDLVLRANAKTGWAIRRDSPKLAAEVDDFFRNWAMKQGVADYRMNAYMKKVKELKDPTASAEYKRFRETLALFEKYGNKYGFDPLMLAAQGYQESQLNQSAKSSVGAIGVMQLMPATGAEMKVGDIHTTEANIHARRQVHGPADEPVLPRCELQRGQPAAVRVRELQLRPGQRRQGAQGSREARARSRQVVQQRRTRHCARRSAPRRRRTCVTSTSTTWRIG